MADRPNIVLLTTDQQRGDCLGIDEHAPPGLQTPNLDMLAHCGVRFRRAYSECPSCIPARRTLLTGLAPASQGLVGMQACDFDPPHTLAGELARAGYQTWLVGKLHLQPVGRSFGFDRQVLSDGPIYRGDTYARWLARASGRDEPDAGWAHGVDPNGWVARPTHLPEHLTHTYWCVSQAIDFIAHHRDPTRPFFLNLSLYDPHPPITPPEIYWNRYLGHVTPAAARGDWVEPWTGPIKGQLTSAWRVNLDERQLHQTRAGYYATINFIDDQVGRFVQFLRRNGCRDTHLLFTSDHGEMLGDHQRFRKSWPYEGSTRVPMFLTHVDRLGAGDGRVCDAPVGLQDVTPTLLSLAGAPKPPTCTGLSLTPALDGAPITGRQALHGEHSGLFDRDGGWHMLVSDSHKYVWYSQRPCEHLFDLRADPKEERDLSRSAGAEALLEPWRALLARVLRDRPEGFVADGSLRRVPAHGHRVPNYEPGWAGRFL